LWEAKTHSSRQYHDITLEALPLAHHLANTNFDVDCLYCYRSPYDARDYGFWVKDCPPIKCWMIPTKRWTQLGVRKFKEILSPFFGEPLMIERSAGSGDPFVIIDQAEKKNLRDWRDLVDGIDGRAKDTGN